MGAKSSVVDRSPAAPDMAREKYLRAMVAVGQSARRGEYVVVVLMAGLFYRTDRLGALAVRALIDGRSDADVIEMIELIEPGAGQRAERLVFALSVKGAMTEVPPIRAGSRWQLRRLAARAMGLAVSVLAPVVRVAPIPVLAWAFRVLLSSPMDLVRRSSRPTRQNGAQASANGSRAVAPVRPKRSFNHLFMYFSVSLTPERLGRLVDHIFDRASADDFAARLDAAEPMIGVYLHGPIFPAVPSLLRTRGKKVVRAIVAATHGINLSERSGPLTDFFGDPPEMTVTVSNALAAGALLRHLKAGRSVYVALDNIQTERDAVTGEFRKPEPVAAIEMLGHYFPRNDGAARLAVRSGRPLALWTTHCSPSGTVVITASPLLHPDPSLPLEQRVATLSTRLYACAEAAIREHPEAWRYWSYLNLITVARPSS